MAATSEPSDNTDRQSVDLQKQFSGTVVSALQNVVSRQLPAEDIIMYLGLPDDAISNVAATDITECSRQSSGINAGVLHNVWRTLLFVLSQSPVLLIQT